MKQIYTTVILLLALLLYCTPNHGQESIYGNFPYSQSFFSTTMPPEISKPSVSSGTNAATFTSGGLRLTPASNLQFGAIFINNRKFSPVNGVRIEFEYMIYGGSGADGFSVFFFNDTTTQPNIGSNGAAIGYTYRRALKQHNNSDRRKGLTGAYLGIAFDSYGNFKSTRFQNEEIIGGIGKGYSGGSHVTLRGSQGLPYPLNGMDAGFTGYPVLITQSTVTNTQTDHEYVVLNSNGVYDYYAANPSYTGNFNLRGGSSFNDETSPAYRKAIIELYPIASGGMYITVKIQHGTTITTVIDEYPYRSVTKYKETAIVSTLSGDNIFGQLGTSSIPIISDTINLPSAVPQFLRVGFAASTGSSNDIHLIKNLTITLPGSAEAYDDSIRAAINTPAVLYPLHNDLAYQGIISKDQVGDSSYINPSSFKFVPIDSNNLISNYEYHAPEGKWLFDTITRTVTFTPVPGFLGVATIQYSIKGGLPGNTEPYADEAYRSLPATITVNVSPQIMALPSSVLCGDSGVVRLEFIGGVDSTWSNIQWYKNGILLPDVSGESICIVSDTGRYHATVVIAGNTYSTNSIDITRDENETTEQPYIYSEENSYVLCGMESSVELRIHEDDLRPGQQTYLWFKDGRPLYDETNYEIAATSAGTYKVLVTEGGCSVFSNEIEVLQGSNTEFRAPVITANPPGERICNVSGSVLLYVSNFAEYGNNAVYNWYKEDLMLQSGSSGMFFASEEGSYTVRVFADGCSALSDPVQLSISPGDTIENAVIASISGSTVLCGEDGIVILQLTEGNYSSVVSYAWFKDGELLSSHPDYQQTTIHIRDTGTYFLRVIDGSCSVISNEIKVEFSPTGNLPEADFRRLPATGQICADQGNIYLYVHNNEQYPNASYIWLHGDTIVKVSSDFWHEATEAGNYSVVISVEDCSIKTGPISLTSSSFGIKQPVIRSTIGNDTICDGNGVMILTLDNVSDFSGITGYQWYKNGIPVSGATHDIYIADTEGGYQLQIMQDNCSSISDAYGVYKDSNSIISNIPLLFFDPGLSICNDGVTRIEVSNADSFPGATYLWYKDLELMHTGTEPVYYTDAPGVYFVQVYYNGCSAVSADSTLTVSANFILTPDIVVEPASAIICGPNGSVIIRLRNYAFFTTPLSYQWYKNDQIVAGQTTPIIIIDSAMGAGTYRLRIQNGYGCVTYTDETNVGYINNSSIVKPIIVPDSATVYPGSPPLDEVTITVTNVDPSASAYLWYNENQLLRRDTNTGTISYTTSNEGTYYVQALYGNDCSAVSNISKVKSSLDRAPQPNITIFPDSYEICQNDGSGVIEITNLSEYTHPTFAWMKVSSPDSLVGTEERLVTIIPGTYYVIVYDNADTSNPIPSIPSNTVIFNPGTDSINRPVILSSGNKICGTNGRIILYPENHTDYYSSAAKYRWLKDGIAVQYSTVPSYVTQSAGIYVLQVFDGNCFSESLPKIIDYENGNYPVPVIDFLGGNELQLCGDSATVILHITNIELFSGASFQWFHNELPLAGDTGVYLRIDTSNSNLAGNNFYRVQAFFGDCSTLSSRKEVKAYSSSVTKPLLERIPAGANLCGDSASVLLRITNVAAFPGYTYYWFKDGNLIVQQGSKAICEVSEPGIYTVYAAGTTCSAESDPENITLSSSMEITKPVITAAGGDLCTGSSEWLLLMTTPETEYTNPTYQWYHNSVLITGMNNPRLTVSAAGEYRLYVIDGNCSALSDTIIVPSRSGSYTYKPVISAVGNHPMCDEGGRTLIQVNDYVNYPGATFNWYRGNTLIQSGSSYFLYAEEPGFYYVHIINSAGCSAVSSELELTGSGSQIQWPVLTTIPDSAALCGIHGRVIIRLDNPQDFVNYTYQWYRNDLPIQNQSGTVINTSDLLITVSSAGSYRIRLTDGNCITFSDPVNVKSDPDSTIANPQLLTYPTNGRLCVGSGSVIIYVANHDQYSAGAVYTWYSDTTKVSEGVDAYRYETDTTGRFFVRILDGYCLAVSSPVTIAHSGDSIAEPRIRSTSNNDTICGQGGSIVLLLDNLSDYSGSASFQWFDGDNNLLLGETGPAIEISNAGRYRIQVYDGNCSTLSPVTEIFRNVNDSVSKPVLSKLPPNAQLCEEGSNFILYVSNDTVYTNPSYQWYKDNRALDGEVEYIYLVTESGDYFVQVTEGDCSSSSEHFTITSDSSGNNIKDAPVIIGADDIYSICGRDGSVLLQLKDTTGFSDVTFHWYRETDSIPNENGPVLIVQDTGTYRLLVKQGECTAFSNAVKVGYNSVNEIDAPVVSMVPETGKLCGDFAVVLFHVVNDQAYTNPNYRWYKDNYPVQDSEFPGYETFTTGDYFVQVLDQSTGCVAVSSPAKTVTRQDSIGQPRITSPSGGSDICATDGSILLLLENDDEFPGAKWQWYRGQDSLPGDTLTLYNATNEGTYRVLVSFNGCYAFSNSIWVTPDSTNNIIAPQLLATPANATICGNGGFVTLSVVNSGQYADSAYHWFKDNRLIENENNATLIVTEAGIYFVQATTDHCSAISDTLSVFMGTKPEFSFVNDTACAPDSVDLRSLVLSSGSIDSLTLAYFDKHYTELNSTFVHNSDTFFIVGINSQGCSDTSEVMITIHPQPQVDIITQDTSICYGNPVELLSMLNTPQTDTVSFFADKDMTVPLLSSVVQPDRDTVFYFLIKNKATECFSAKDSLSVHVHTLPICTITGSDSLCPGTTSSYSAPGNMMSYNWSISGAGSIISALDTATISVEANNLCHNQFILSLSITDSNGCASSCNSTIEISTSDQVQVRAPVDTIVDVCDFTHQNALNITFNNWLSRFGIAAAGCNATGDFESIYNAPLLCSGDSVIVTYLASDGCSSDTVSRVFKISEPDSVKIQVPNDTLFDICAFNAQVELNLVFDAWKSKFTVINDGCGVIIPELSACTIPYHRCADTSVTIIYSVNDACTQASATRTFSLLRDTIAPVITGNINPDTLCAGESLPAPATNITELNSMGVMVSDNCFPDDQLLVSSYDLPDNITTPQFYTRYYIISDSCGHKDSISQILLMTPPSPPIYSNAYCENEVGGSVLLTSSQTGVEYQLMWNGTPYDSPKTGTGDSLLWSPLPEGTGYYVQMHYTLSPDCSGYSDTVNIIKLTQPYVGIPQDSVATPVNSIISIPVSYSGSTPMKVFYSVVHTMGSQNDTLDILPGTPSPFNWMFTVPGDTGVYHIILDSVVASTGCKALCDSIFTIYAFDCQSDNFHIICPNDTVLEIPYGSCEYGFGSIGYPTIGNMPGNNLDTIIYRGPEGLIFSKGIYEIEWVAIDKCGKRDSCKQMVIVNLKPCGNNDTVYYFDGSTIRDSVRNLEAVDFEQNRYPTVRIGCDCWTAENLTSTKYADGANIENHYSYYSEMYPDTNANVTKYGRLYDWYGAARQPRPSRSIEIQGACPDGWILPTSDHYRRLIGYSSDALRMPGEWINDQSSHNSTGFGALPAGYYNNSTNIFYYLMGDTYFWTSDQPSQSIGKACHIRYNCPVIMIIDFNTAYGSSIRCVKIDD